MKQLYVCRHGQSELNVQEIFAGQLDTPLTDLGREQAHNAGASAVGLNVDKIVSSPLVRALETAQIIAEHISYPKVDIVVNDVFMERSYGSLEGKPWSVEVDDFDTVPGVVTDVALRLRVQQGLEALRAIDAETVLLVGHGSHLLELAKQLGLPADHELPNATITQLI